MAVITAIHKSVYYTIYRKSMIKYTELAYNIGNVGIFNN